MLVVLLAVVLFATGGAGCGNRTDVEARVASISAALQEAAAQGRITPQELAARIVRVNSAATAYETSKDASAFCEALNALDAEFKQAQ